MKRKSFKMQLKPGCEEEYVKRYNALWPDLKTILKDSGMIHFSIYLERETGCLYAFQIFKGKGDATEHLRENPIMKKWWEFMSDIVCMNEDYTPIEVSLEEVFHIDWIK